LVFEQEYKKFDESRFEFYKNVWYNYIIKVSKECLWRFYMLSEIKEKNSQLFTNHFNEVFGEKFNVSCD
jgi:hypothetical protein